MSWKERKRSHLSRAFVVALVIVLSATSLGPAKAQESSSEPTGATNEDFDFENGNAILEVVIPQTSQPLRELFPGGDDVTIVIRFVSMLQVGFFDSIAPYHPTAVGFYSDLDRRPASEGEDNRNRNISVIYGSYRILNSIMPEYAADWREMVESVGLDPDDDQENTYTPVGIGNLAGKGVVEGRENDGQNQLGNEGGREYNMMPYADYTGYQPVNTAEHLRNPKRWQPDVVDLGNGTFASQQAVTPQLAVTESYSVDDPRDFHVRPPQVQGYRQQADEVLEASAELNDERKVRAEFFNDKLLFLGDAFATDDQLLDLDMDGLVMLGVATQAAAFDTLIAAWDAKFDYDYVRPFSAINFLYGGKNVTAWGGPGEGTVDDLPGDQWRSYIPTADHPEHPSATAALCAAVAQAGKRIFEDITESVFVFPQGASFVEPGITPAEDVALRWDDWDHWVEDCGLSRLWGGTHFMPAIEEGWKLGEQVGNDFWYFVQSHVEGERPTTDRHR